MFGCGTAAFPPVATRQMSTNTDASSGGSIPMASQTDPNSSKFSPSTRFPACAAHRDEASSPTGAVRDCLRSSSRLGWSTRAAARASARWGWGCGGSMPPLSVARTTAHLRTATASAWCASAASAYSAASLRRASASDMSAPMIRRSASCAASASSRAARSSARSLRTISPSVCRSAANRRFSAATARSASRSAVALRRSASSSSSTAPRTSHAVLHEPSAPPRRHASSISRGVGSGTGHPTHRQRRALKRTGCSIW